MNTSKLDFASIENPLLKNDPKVVVCLHVQIILPFVYDVTLQPLSDHWKVAVFINKHRGGFSIGIFGSKVF